MKDKTRLTPAELDAQAPDQLRQHQFTLDFAIGAKSSGEVEHEGQIGIFAEGLATQFDVVDGVGEWTTPDSFKNAAHTFFETGHKNGPLRILYHHGLHPLLSTRPIGRLVEWAIDERGVAIKAFIPKPTDLDNAIGQKALEIYEGIRGGLIDGWSIGGIFGKAGRAIKSVGLYEISITPIPCLDTARFELAGKSLPGIEEMLDDAGATAPASAESLGAQLAGIVSAIAENVLGQKAAKDAASEKKAPPPTQHGLSRAAHGKALALAQKERSRALHDHLLNHEHYPPEAQGAHDPDDCSVCAERQDMYGVKGLDAPGVTSALAAAAAPPSPDYGTDQGDGESPLVSPDDAAPLDASPSSAQTSARPGVKTLAPASLPARMVELTTLALDLSHLHANLSRLDALPAPSEPDGAAAATAQLGGKAGAKLSGLSLQTLRQFATQVVAAGQELHAWLDQHAPGLTDPAVEAQKQAAATAQKPAPAAAPAPAPAKPAVAPPAAPAKPAAASSSSPSSSKKKN